MMIYGVKATQIAVTTLKAPCPHCSTPDSVKLAVLQKYAHIFWIPFIPVGKTGASECAHCKQVLTKKEFTGELQDAYATLKINSKTPMWTFAGMALLALLIAWGIYSSGQTDAKNAKLLEAPQKGDIYEIKIAAGQYTLFKVDHVAGDTVYILANSYETNKLTGLNDLKNKGVEAYEKTPLPLLKAELKKMLEKGEIYDIERK